jgi:hypothetical protein
VLWARFASLSFLLLAAPAFAGALQTTLTWVVGADTVLFQESVTASEKGFAAVITTSVGEYDTLSMDKARSTLEWKRKVPGENTDLVAVRTGGQVRINGTYKGKPYDRTLDFGDLPWYQFQEISYEQFHASGAKSGSFWTIDRKTLKPSQFRADKSEPETITIMGSPVRTAKYDLTVRGVPAFIFKAHFWVREADGRFLRLSVPPIFNLPQSVVELSSER